MDDHQQAVLTAKTHGDLVPILASLPDIDTGRTVTLAGKSGRFRRRGAWQAPRILKVDSEYGKVDLDPSRAIIEKPAVEIKPAAASTNQATGSVLNWSNQQTHPHPS